MHTTAKQRCTQQRQLCRAIGQETNKQRHTANLNLPDCIAWLLPLLSLLHATARATRYYISAQHPLQHVNCIKQCCHTSAALSCAGHLFRRRARGN